MLYSVHSRAIPFLLILGISALVTWFAGWMVVCLILLIGAGYVAFFFRSPRLPCDTVSPGQLLSPAWGTVSSVETVTDGPGGISCWKISIFLSIFDVHLQYMPTNGSIGEISYQKGKFINAMNEDAARVNEQNLLTLIPSDDTPVIRITQIAGLIARRIECFVRPGEVVSTRQCFGLIQFGSRVNIEIPSHFKVRVRPGDKVRGGLTLLAEHSPRETPLPTTASEHRPCTP